MCLFTLQFFLHSVARFAGESLHPSSRPRYVLTPQPLSIRDSLGHGLSHDFGALGGTYPDVGRALDAFSLYAKRLPQFGRIGTKISPSLASCRVASKAAPHHWKGIQGMLS